MALPIITGMPADPVGAPSIRIALPDTDAAGVAAIYAPHVTDGLASFEAVAPSGAEMRERMLERLRWAPWLVSLEPDATDGERVTGYAYAGRHADRAGYRWDVDVSVYIAPDHQGLGLGRRLYDLLLPILRLQRFVNAYAGVALPNPASMRLHEAIGMRHLVTYERVGWKHGAWLDVAWLHMLLVPAIPDPPAEPIPLPELLADAAGRVAVEAILRG
jgi:phosphinothricin acetyltransferase